MCGCTNSRKVCHLNTNRMLSSPEDRRGTSAEAAASLCEHNVRPLVWGRQHRRSVHMKAVVQLALTGTQVTCMIGKCVTVGKKHSNLHWSVYTSVQVWTFSSSNLLMHRLKSSCCGCTVSVRRSVLVPMCLFSLS